MIGSAEILQSRILIVDDQAANVALLEQMLRRAGYTAVAATQDPYQVCALHRQNRYDLILLDLQMPGMDGFEVMEGLKEIEGGSYLPVLVITAQPDHKVRALKSGAKDFVGKPFELSEVLVRVYNMLEIRLLHRNEALLSQARLETSQRVSGLGDWEYDFEQDRLVWSEEVYRILGIRRQDFPPDAETFYRHVHPDDLAFVHREKLAAATSLRRVEFEHRIVRSSGEVRHIHQIAEVSLDAAGRPLREAGTLQDITERKLSEVALRESEERFRKMLLLSPDAQFVHVAGLVTFVNQAFCRLMGGSDAAPWIGRAARELTDPYYRKVDGVARADDFATLPGLPSEMRFVRLDGTPVDVEVMSVTLDFGGREEVQVIARDITARKRAEEELSKKTTLLEAQIDSSADGIIMVDVAGKKIMQNQRFVDLMAIPPALAEGDNHEGRLAHIAGIVHQPEAMIAKVRHLYAHPEESSRDELALRNGTVLDRQSSPILNKEGRYYGRIWSFRDITATKAAELALRASEERFKFVARAVSDVVWDWDLAANTIWWNDGFLTTFGFVAGEIEPSVASWTGRIHPDERNRVVDSIHRAINGGAEIWNAEYRFQRKDGTYAFVQDRGYILRDATGAGTRMVGGMRDLSEQKKLEAHYLRAQRMDSIGTLAGGIAHDLNNVLAPIMMSIELLKLDAGGDPRRGKILDTIYVSSRRGADLVKQVLSFARGLDGQRIAIRLRHLIDELEGIISETFPRGIRILTEAPSDLWPLLGDPTQLNQVLLNLAVNARDAMPHGGTLTLTASNLMIHAPAASATLAPKAGPYVLLQVADTGLGIPPEARERIFEPFFTTKEIGRGTGLGLATVHTIVKSHGGFLNVESEMGLGTVFKIYLPADPTSRTEDAAPAAALPRGQGELVLVVDDEFSIRDITRQTLEAFGYQVITANDGAEALALYGKQAAQIAVVLTDMMMPIMDGATAIQRIRSINPSVRVIVASGLERSEDVTRAGVRDFLPKPYTAQSLVQLVRAVIDRPASRAVNAGELAISGGGA